MIVNMIGTVDGLEGVGRDIPRHHEVQCFVSVTKGIKVECKNLYHIDY
jgi:hypothetical protein